MRQQGPPRRCNRCPASNWPQPETLGFLVGQASEATQHSGHRCLASLSYGCENELNQQTIHHYDLAPCRLDSQSTTAYHSSTSRKHSTITVSPLVPNTTRSPEKLRHSTTSLNSFTMSPQRPRLPSCAEIKHS
jgi:hypothetical protein